MENGVVRVPEQRVRGASGQRHGDSAIAGALAFYASQISVPVMAYTPARTHPANGQSAVNNSAAADRDMVENEPGRSRMRSIAGAW